MISTLADQYLAQNAGRRYPLADDAGYDDIPDDTAILDFRCTVRGVPHGSVPRARITKVTQLHPSTDDKIIDVTVDWTGAQSVLQFAIPVDIADDAPYVAVATDAATGAEGTLTVSSSVLRQRSLSTGPKDVPLAWTTVVCDSMKVDSIQSAQEITDATDKDDPAGRQVLAVLSGEIVLAEGRNSEPYLDGNRLRIDMRKGGGLGERCQSAVSGYQKCDTVLFTINGERPGSDGNIRITGHDGITVTPDPDNHAIEIRMDDVATSRATEGCAQACQEG